MFSFLNPALLWLFPLLAAPVIFHFMKRSIAVNITFPTIRFLSIGKIPKEGKRRLRDLFLLILRLLLLALIILAVAGPVQTIPKEPIAVDSTVQRVIIAFDFSASMGIYADRSKLESRLDSIFQRKIEARLFVFDEQVRTFESTVRTPLEVLKAVDQFNRRPLVTKGSVLSHELTKQIQEFGATKVYLISDFQKTSWSTASLQRLPKGTELEFVDVRQELNQNLAILKSEVRESAGDQRTVLVTLQNFSQTDQTVELQFSDGLQIKMKTVTVPRLKVLNTTLIVDRNESVKAQIKILGKSLDFDDQYSLWMGKFPPVEVLAISPLKEKRDEELFFLTKALGIRQKKSPRSVNVTPVTYDLFDLVDLSKVSGIIFMGSVAYLEKSSLIKLKSFLEAGGTVLVSPGKAAALQYQKLQQSGLFNCKFNGVNRSAKNHLFFVNKVNESTLLSSVFSNPGEGDLYQFPIRKYCRTQTFLPAKDILLSTDDDALFSVQVHKEGQLYVLAFAMDTDWSELPISTSFIPIIHEVFKTGQESGVTRMTVGAYYKVYKGTGDPFQSTARLFEQRPVEVNVDRAESSPQKVDFSELRHALMGDLDFHQVAVKGDLEKSMVVSYQKELVLAVVILLLFEILISLLADVWSFNKTEEI